MTYEYSTDGNKMSRMQGGVKTWYAYDFRDKNGVDRHGNDGNGAGGVAREAQERTRLRQDRQEGDEALKIQGRGRSREADP